MTDPSSMGSASASTPALSGDIATVPSADTSPDGADSRAGFFNKLKVLFKGASADAKRDGIREMIEDGRAEHFFRPEEQRILGNLVTLGDQRVDDIMVPRADIVALPRNMPIEEMVKKFVDSGFSRLPVYEEQVDDISGMVHIKDLIPFWGAQGAQDIQSVMRQVLFVPPNMEVLDLLLRVQSTGIHMALVVDEYGGIDGLLTIEDLVEAVVGEIADSGDRTTDPEIRPQADGSLIVDARVDIEDLEKHLGFDLLPEDREEDIDTIGGLVFDLADRVPTRGEELTHPSGMRLIVLNADPRRIHRLRVILPPPGE